MPLLHALLLAIPPAIPPRAVPAQDDEPPYPADTEIQTTESGLRYSVLARGSGEERPYVGDRVRIHFTGWTPDGLRFDGTRIPDQPGQPIAPRELGVGDPDRPLMSGFQEGLQLMRVGDHFKFTIPWNIAYGEKGSALFKVPPKTDLIFEVELVEIVSRSLRYVPWSRGGAKRTESGLRYQVLASGDGPECSGADLVYLEYGVWNEEGRLVNSSGVKNRPIVAAPGELKLPFMLEAMQSMRAGDHWLLRVPAELGFGDQAMRGLPAGSLSVWQVRVERALRFEEPPFALPAPESSTVTDGGARYEVLRAGDGRSPRRGGKVVLHHAAWLADGTRVDSSYARGKASTWALGQLPVSGWSEILPRMSEGEIVRVVLPPEMAYGESGSDVYGVPPGATLVYVIELIQVLQ